MSRNSSTEYGPIDLDDGLDSPNLEKATLLPPQNKKKSNALNIGTCILALALWALSIYGAVKASNAALQDRLHFEHTKFCDARLGAQAEKLAGAFRTAGTSNAAGKTHGEPPSSYTPLTCGSSSAEAEALGCVFDPLVASWLPAGCPNDGSAEFAALVERENLTYWRDEDGRPTGELIDPAHFRHMDGVMYWGTRLEHLSHCAYTLKRIVHAQHRGDRLDVVAGNFSHTDHCVNFLVEGLKMDPAELKELYRTDLPIQFLSC
ncbi:hypothetical protein PG990_002412 [Apiospora arundinis]